MIRGLIERIDNPNDKRSFLYRPTFELLSFMGVEKVENLQDYEKIKDDLNDFMNENTDEEDVVGKSQEEDVNV
jgi:chromosome segregation and condensation protein ScpB